MTNGAATPGGGRLRTKLEVARRVGRVLARERDPDGLVRSFLDALVASGAYASAQLVRSGESAPASGLAVRAADAGTLLLALPEGTPLDDDERAFAADLADDFGAALALARTPDESVLRIFVESAPVAVAMFDRDMRYLAHSGSYLRAYRLHDTSLVGKCHYDVFPNLGEERRAAHRRVLAGETLRSDDARFTHADGTMDYVRWEMRPWRAADGSVGGAIFFTEMITARRQMENALRASEERFRTIFEQAGVGVALVETQTGRFVSINQRYGDIVGRSREEMLAGGWPLITHPDDVPFSEGIAEKLVSGRVASFTGEKRYLHADGSSVWVEVTVAPLHQEHVDVPLHITVVQDITARKRAEEAVRESEVRLRRALELLPVPTTLASRNGKVILLNRAFTERYGWSIGDLATAADFSAKVFADPAESEASRRRWATGAADIEIARGRLVRFLRKDGGERDVELTNRVVDDFVVTVFADVTDARAAEDALREQLALREQVASLAGAIPGVLHSVRQAPDGTLSLVYVNEALEELVGVPVAAAREDASLILERVHPRERALVAAARERSRADLTPLHVVYRIRHPDRGEVWIEERAQPLRESDGGTLWHGVLTDITEAKRAQDALRAGEERYRLVVDNLDEIVFVTDEAGVWTFVNHAIEGFGYTAAQVVGRMPEHIVHPDDRARFRERHLAKLGGAVGPPQEMRIIDASGKVRHVRSAFRAIRVRERIVGLTGVLVDLTLQRETEEQLRSAQRMEAVGRLAGGIAHDFNNMLSVILSYADLALASLHDEDPLRADLEEIGAAARRAEALTRQLLTFSRRHVVRAEALDVDDVLQGLARMLERLIGEDIDLRLELAHDCVATKADRGQLEQVVMNLVVNARDAMPGGGALTIRTRHTDIDDATASRLEIERGPHVVLEVTDTGTGMDEATRLRIFEPFFTTKPVGKGTGLGLSTVYGIVKQSGGAIEVTSAPDKGTTFRVVLPAIAPAEAAAGERSRREGATRGSGLRELILVVEDEPPLRAVLRRVLGEAGFEVLVAANAAEALMIAREHSRALRLVMTDVVMPGMNGRELAEQLAPICPTAKILYTSGYTFETVATHGTMGDDFLPKPYDRESLTRMVRAMLDRP